VEVLGAGPAGAQYAAVVRSIVLMVLKLFLLGLLLGERSAANRRYANRNNWEEYGEYLRGIILAYSYSKNSNRREMC
jgi:hypothetical protein